jgi:predicted phosphodiesterase
MRLMRVGLMSDLHGNSIAVRRVLEDGHRRGVERWWILGDIVALGPDPVGVLELLAELPDVAMISGNTERYVLTGDRPYPSLDDVKANHELMPQLVEVATSFAWTRGMLTQAGWLSWLESLPSELRWTLPDETRVLGVHASPRSDDGDGIDSRISDTDLERLLQGCDADVVFAGHTHDAVDRTVGLIRAVNLGSVSNPHRADGCATYVTVEVRADSHELEHHVVDYDRQAVLDQLDAVRHPAGGYLRCFFVG